jgi:hypothetical protein
MSQRGRGTLEINPSRNPFFHTTSSDIGAKIHERSQMEWDRPSSNSSRGLLLDDQSPHQQLQQQDQQDKEPNSANNYGEDFSFLYARSSDTIGSKVPQRSSNNLLGQCMDTKPLVHKKRLQDTGTNILNGENNKPQKKNVEAILESYHHVPKDQNPLYTTSMNDYGKKLPSVATYVADRAYRPQDFSKSFNGIKPKNSSLNTAVTKSTIHPKLDPQFI